MILPARNGSWNMYASKDRVTLEYFKPGKGQISVKDASDGALAIGLAFVAVSNPIGLVVLGVYGFLDAARAFDGPKEN